MVGEPIPCQKSDDELLAMVDQPIIWLSIDGPAKSLRGAIIRAVQIAAAGRTPFPLKGPDPLNRAAEILVDRIQMFRLGKRRGTIP